MGGGGGAGGGSASHTSCMPGKGCSALPLHTFLSYPHTLLLSRDFYFLTFLLLPQEDYQFLVSFQRGLPPTAREFISRTNLLSLPRQSLTSPDLGLPSLQRSFPLISLALFQDAHLPGWSLLSSRELSLPPLPCRDTPSRSPLPSWALTSSLSSVSDALLSPFLSRSLAL